MSNKKSGDQERHTLHTQISKTSFYRDEENMFPLLNLCSKKFNWEVLYYRASVFLLEFMEEPISTMEVVNHPIADVWGPEWLQPSLMACLGFEVWTICGNTVPKRLTLRHKWMVARDHAISKWLIFQFLCSNFRFDFLLGVPPCPCPLTICDPKAYCQCIGRSRPNQPIWRGVPVFIR